MCYKSICVYYKIEINATKKYKKTEENVSEEARYEKDVVYAFSQSSLHINCCFISTLNKISLTVLIEFGHCIAIVKDKE